jgi:HEAT repeat protein
VDFEPDVRSACAQALGCIDSSDAVRCLEMSLADQSQMVKISCAQSLGRLGKKAIGAKQALCRSLDDGSSDVRAFALQALKQIGAFNKDLVPLLLRCQSDTEAWIREFAREGIEEIKSR